MGDLYIKKVKEGFELGVKSVDKKIVTLSPQEAAHVAEFIKNDGDMTSHKEKGLKSIDNFAKSMKRKPLSMWEGKI